MQKLEIVLGIIEQGDSYIFQFRDGDPKIGAAGLIGFFGGKIEPDEDPVAAVVRELTEETNLHPQSEDMCAAGVVSVKSDYQLKPVAVTAQVFHTLVGPGTVIEALEGTLVRMNYKESIANLSRMTPGTRACFEEGLIYE